MVGYHLTWDLAYFGFVDRHVPFAPLMRVYSHSVASAFLLLVGVSLALAHRDGPRWRAFFWRLAKIVAAAALVTVGSLIFAPEFAIWFGILHCIAAASVIAALFLNAPIGVAFVVGWAAIVAPQFIQSADLNAPALVWLGLGTQDPSTLDWRPLLPWAGVAWIGFDLARLALPKIHDEPALALAGEKRAGAGARLPRPPQPGVLPHPPARAVGAAVLGLVAVLQRLARSRMNWKSSTAGPIAKLPAPAKLRLPAPAPSRNELARRL